VTAMLSLYLNVFVLIIQSFLKVPALHALAPSVPPSEPPFAVVQGIVLVFFVIVIIGAVRRYRPMRHSPERRGLGFRHSGGDAKRRTSDVRLHIGESRDSGSTRSARVPE